MGSSQHINTFLLLGLTLICTGALIMVLDEALIQPIITDYWKSDAGLVADDSWLDLMEIGWEVMGTVVFLIGIIVTIMSGMKSKSRAVP